jgi:hypothetical protein
MAIRGTFFMQPGEANKYLLCLAAGKLMASRVVGDAGEVRAVAEEEG